jgi:hypothetical protein
VIGRTLCGISAIVVPLAAHGQGTSFWTDIGSARIRYADSIDVSALSVSPTFRASGQRATLAAAGTLSRLTNAWSNSALLTVATRVGRAEPFFTEVEGQAGGSMHSDGGRTGQYLASARARVEEPARGLWLGGGLGQSWDAELRNVIQGDLGAWIAWGANSATLQVTPTRVNGTVEYADTFAWIRRVSARWQFDGTAGPRRPDPRVSRRALSVAQRAMETVRTDGYSAVASRGWAGFGGASVRDRTRCWRDAALACPRAQSEPC